MSEPFPARRNALRIAVLHPELTVGGAERVMVDAAAALQAAGHAVTLFTARLDRQRAFTEAVDGTLRVRVVAGGLLPGAVAQRLRVPCAVAGSLWLAAAAAAAARRGGWDAVLCDQVAQAVPLARRWCRAPVVFYCHFPDRLLAPAGGRFYGWYRGPLDRLEAAGMACADRVLVNSRFTAAAFRGAFPHAAAPAVVYPGVEIAACNPALATVAQGGGAGGPATILSLARFAPAKGVELAIDALAELRTAAPAAFAGCRLVLAGSCDERVREQRETRAALAARCTALGLDGRVELRPSVDEAERRALLAGCRFLVYTPAAEHFGMVPIEAMAAGRPVVAIAGGGPAETVVDGETGYLCPPAPAALAAAFARLLDRPDLAARLGAAGRRHVEHHFSRAAFGAAIEAALQQAVRGRVQRYRA